MDKLPKVWTIEWIISTAKKECRDDNPPPRIWSSYAMETLERIDPEAAKKIWQSQKLALQKKHR